MKPFNQDKFNVVKVEVLIKAVQDAAFKMKDIKWKKKMGSKSMVRFLRDLRGMQASLCRRLAEMNNMDPYFFPVGSHIEYKNPQVPGQPRDGTVVEHLPDRVVIDLTEEKIRVAADPYHLKLKFIRVTY